MYNRLKQNQLDKIGNFIATNGVDFHGFVQK